MESKYNLYVYTGENGSRWQTENPTSKEVKAAVSELRPGEYTFLILSCKKPNPDNIEYIQVATLEKARRGKRFQVEMRFEYKGTYPHFRQYRIFIDDIALLQAFFTSVAAGYVPKTTKWKDITQEILNKTRNNARRGDARLQPLKRISKGYERERTAPIRLYP